MATNPLRVALIPFTGIDPENDGSSFGSKIARRATNFLNSSPILDIVVHGSCNNVCMRYLSMEEIQRKASLDYIIDGTVRVSSTHYIIDVDFTDCTTGGLIFSERFKHAKDDPDIDGLAEEIINQLMITFNFLFIAQMPDRLHA
ncbi:hypothetical protein RDV64_03780 [Acuticoccus sp. MNP-M23]|uniref:hypothetical protein n=1 Tax=Acuticoccus sp. MNP-M23 TaxID=3072793 RepID=UPI002814BF13|nr:hypothetical protein [Acuticoccus sp. MNP-M23]WMS43530.1 hypothetical protein RDV64_03780 [Acuticoccus sp. MNP-M23]